MFSVVSPTKHDLDIFPCMEHRLCLHLCARVFPELKLIKIISSVTVLP